MNNRETPPLLFEMLRSFVSLARSLNLSHTVKDLGSTRQTVRRHIATLEKHKNGPLFAFENRQYVLTKTGKEALREAEELIARSNAWLRDESRHVDELLFLDFQAGPVPYHLQQHPLTAIWDKGSALMKFGFHAWADSEGDLESPAFGPLRPYLMVFRRNGATGEWICTEVGEKSSYATWFGWQIYRSTVGKAAETLLGGVRFNSLMAKPFEDIATTRGIRLDHIHTQIEQGADKGLTPISYQRLTMASRFADGEFALVALVDRTNDIQIDGLADDIRQSMPTELEMNVSPPAAAGD